MKYMAGYQLQKSGAFIREIIKQKAHIHEVYFSWGAQPSGRGQTVRKEGLMPHEALEIQAQELKLLSDSGISLNLLLNANCYGRDSLSRAFLMDTGDLIDHLGSRYALTSATTTSPVLAHFIRRNFEGLEVRASVNMEIGSTEAMEYLADDFDSFYYKRELNRDIPHLARLKKWCDANGKQLYMLANSGCLNNCPARQFHDNLVAHETEIAKMDNGAEFRSLCSRFDAQRPMNILSRLNFVRPEEMALYEPYVTAAKLATRVSPRPEAILRAYVQGSFRGNVLELTEPAHAAAFLPAIAANDRLPSDFSQHVAHCAKNCESCNYCTDALKNALVTLDEGGIFNADQRND